MKSKIYQRYEFIQLLGKGAFGEVHKVLDKKTDKIIALKFTKVFPDTLRKEFASLTKLSHPNLIKVYEHGSWTGKLYFTMEYVQGTDVVSFCRGKQIEDQLLVIKELLEGIRYIHTCNLTHGDIKPSNILVGKDGLKIIDFSLASNSLSAPSTAGTVGYLAPEMIKNGEITPQGDLYSLGVLLYEMLAGSYPFQGSDLQEIYQEQIKKKFVPLRQLCPGISVKIEEVISRLLEPFPQDRFSGIEKVIQELFPESVKNERIVMPYIGRNELMKKIHKLIEKRKQNGLTATSTIIIQAEAGMGKTTVLRALCDVLSLEGMTVLQDAEKPDNLPLSSIVKELYLTAPRELVHRYKKILATFYPDLNEITESDSRNTPVDFRQIIYFINEALSSTYTFNILVVDDIHYMNLNGINIFNYLSKNLNEHTIIIATMNADMIVKPLTIKKRTFKLKGLLPDQLAELTQNNFGEMLLQKQFVKKAHSLTLGNPLLFKEFLHQCRINEVIKWRGAYYSINLGYLESIVLDFPTQIDDIFQLRLKNLSSNTIDTLKFFAVLTEKIPNKLILQLFNNVEFLEEAYAFDILLEKSSEIQFTHPVLRHVFYQLLSCDEKKYFHRKAGGVFEKHYPEKSAKILYHFLMAEDGDGIRRNYPALLNRINPVTLNLVQEGLPYIKKNEVKQRAIKVIAYMFMITGNLSDAHKYYLKALNSEHDRKEKILILLKLGCLEKDRNEYKNALKFLQEGINLFVRQDDELYCRLLAEIALINTHLGKIDEAFILFEKALKLARAKKMLQEEGNILLKMAMLYWYKSDHEKIVELDLKVIEIAKKFNNVVALATANNNLGVCSMEINRFKEAEVYLNKALKLWKNIGNIGEIPRCLANLGAVYIGMGLFPQAQMYIDQAMNLVSKKNRVFHHCITLKGQINAILGNFIQACIEFDKILKIKEKEGDILWLDHIHYYLANSYFEMGIYNKALHHVDQLLENHIHSPSIENNRNALMLLLRIQDAIGAFARAKETADILGTQKSKDSYVLAIKGDLDGAVNAAKKDDYKMPMQKQTGTLLFFYITEKYLFARNISDAEKCWKTGKKMSNEINLRVSSAMGLYLKGRIVFEKRGALGPMHSLHSFEEAKRHFDKMNMREYQWRTDYHLGKCKLLLGNKHGAVCLFDEALKIIEEMEITIIDDELRVDFKTHPERVEFFRFLDSL
ncbi:protein kinase [bacterium]|nr:protein kinase [bacterium]